MFNLVVGRFNKLLKMNLSKLKSISSKGFTLIELLIVIAILGVLAAAILVAINPGQRIASARNARVKSDLANVGAAANLFNADTGISAACASGGSYPNAWSQTACGQTFMAAPLDPVGTAFTLSATPASCTAATAGAACTAIAVYGPAYSDGTIDASTNNKWCWRSATGSITQTTAALCLP